MIEKSCWDLLKDNMMDNKREWQDFIESWFGKSEYLAELGFPHRKITRNLEQTFRQLLFFSAQMRNDTYATVYTFRKMKYVEHATNPQRKHTPDYSSAFINKVAFDLDFDKKKDGCMQDAYDDVMKMIDFYNGNCRAYFTTNKGFQLYIDLLLSITKEDLRKYSIYMIDGLDINTADRVVIADLARIFRLPYTIHSKTNMFVLPIDRNMSLKEIFERSGSCVTPRPLLKKSIDISEFISNSFQKVKTSVVYVSVK